jgi:hypothetical protein
MENNDFLFQLRYQKSIDCCKTEQEKEMFNWMWDNLPTLRIKLNSREMLEVMDSLLVREQEKNNCGTFSNS